MDDGRSRRNSSSLTIPCEKIDRRSHPPRRVTPTPAPACVCGEAVTDSTSQHEEPPSRDFSARDAELSLAADLQAPSKSSLAAPFEQAAGHFRLHVPLTHASRNYLGNGEADESADKLGLTPQCPPRAIYGVFGPNRNN